MAFNLHALSLHDNFVSFYKYFQMSIIKYSTWLFDIWVPIVIFIFIIKFSWNKNKFYTLNWWTTTTIGLHQKPACANALTYLIAVNLFVECETSAVIVPPPSLSSSSSLFPLQCVRGIITELRALFLYSVMSTGPV